MRGYLDTSEMRVMKAFVREFSPVYDTDSIHDLNYDELKDIIKDIVKDM